MLTSETIFQISLFLIDIKANSTTNKNSKNIGSCDHSIIYKKLFETHIFFHFLRTIFHFLSVWRSNEKLRISFQQPNNGFINV